MESRHQLRTVKAQRTPLRASILSPQKSARCASHFTHPAHNISFTQRIIFRAECRYSTNIPVLKHIRTNRIKGGTSTPMCRPLHIIRMAFCHPVKSSPKQFIQFVTEVLPSRGRGVFESTCIYTTETSSANTTAAFDTTAHTQRQNIFNHFLLHLWNHISFFIFVVLSFFYCIFIVHLLFYHQQCRCPSLLACHQVYDHPTCTSHSHRPRCPQRCHQHLLPLHLQ